MRKAVMVVTVSVVILMGLGGASCKPDPVVKYPPNANFNWSPKPGVVGQPVYFTDLSGDPDGNVVAWLWNFGDGNGTTVRNPSHTYDTADTYTVTLTVTDNDGLADSHQEDIEIGNGVVVTATIQATDASAAEPSDTGIFTITLSPAPSSDVSVNYSVGGSATNGADYSLSPSSPITFSAGQSSRQITITPINDSLVETTETVTVTLTSGSGYSIGSPSSATVSIADDDDHVVNAPNTPNGVSMTEIDTSVSFASGGSTCSQACSVEYRFDWGDGTFSSWSTAPSRSHSWSIPGEYSVRAQARCSVTLATSSWSGTHDVIAWGIETIQEPGDMVGDCYVDDWEPSTTHNTDWLYSGSWGDYNDTVALVHFDLSAIPSGSTILEADLQLYWVVWGNNDLEFFSVYAMASGWSEWTLTWNGYAGLMYYTTPYCQAAPLSVANWTTWGTNADSPSTAVKTWVQRWVDGTYANNGFQIVMQGWFDTGEDANVAFASSEYATESRRPKLVVKYY